MLSFLRQSVPRTNTADQNKTYYEDGRACNEFHRDGFLTTQQLPPVSDVPSFFTPPMHRHMKQDEHFHVVSGSGRWTLLGKHHHLSAGENIVIPQWLPHTFENMSQEHPLVISAKYTPDDLEMEERFFRNVFGYFDDCRKAAVSPSIFQLCKFLDDAYMPIAVTPGPEWIAKWADWAFMVVMGRYVGGWVLGYQATYPEYYNPKMQ